MVLTTTQNITTMQYPNGQLHYCYKNYQISVKGFDGIAYSMGEGKRAYASTKEQDSCFYLNKHFNSTATVQCSLSNIQIKHFALLFKKGGCSVGLHFYNNSYTVPRLSAFSNEIIKTLENNGLHTYKHQYLFKEKIKIHVILVIL